MTISAFDDYLNSLSQLSNPFDPTVPTADSEEIRTVAGALAALANVDRKSLGPKRGSWLPRRASIRQGQSSPTPCARSRRWLRSAAKRLGLLP